MDIAAYDEDIDRESLLQHLDARFDDEVDIFEKVDSSDGCEDEGAAGIGEEREETWFVDAASGVVGVFFDRDGGT